MGSFLFKWDHPAQEVYVTGTFDDWSKSVKLEKKAGRFEKLVELNPVDDKIDYKFVVDGEWTTDPTAPKEKDDANNENNFLLPENINRSDINHGFGGATISGITPGSTTAQLASNVPKEPGHGRNDSAASDAPGSFPEAPFHDAQEFSVNPIPATSGAGNPVSLKPGAKVPDPSTITTNDTTTADSLDKESYEKAGSAQPPSSSKAETSAFDLPPVGRGVIPESSLPMGGDVPSIRDTGPTIQSSGAGTSTAALAANVPKEPRGVPIVISENQQSDAAGPEASGNQNAVAEGKASKESATSDAPVIGGGRVPPSVQQAIGEYHQSVPIAPTVPDVVQESIAESKTAPEAAASKQAVDEKSAVEKQLLKDVKPTNTTGEPAPATTAALTDKAPAPTNSKAPVTSAEAPAQTSATQSSMAQALREQSPASRDVSPLSHPAGQKPTVTTGVASSSTPAKSAPGEAAASPASPASKSSVTASTDKKSKRSSGFFGKIKDKLKHHEK